MTMDLLKFIAREQPAAWLPGVLGLHGLENRLSCGTYGVSASAKSPMPWPHKAMALWFSHPRG